MSSRPLLRLAAGGALALAAGAACALLVHVLERRIGLCPDSLVERAPRAAPATPAGAPLPWDATARAPAPVPER
jgi:hypothetical protein